MIYATDEVAVFFIEVGNLQIEISKHVSFIGSGPSLSLFSKSVVAVSSKSFPFVHDMYRRYKYIYLEMLRSFILCAIEQLSVCLESICSAPIQG